MKKYLLFILIFPFFSLSAQKPLKWTKFKWDSYTDHAGRFHEKAAMIVPVKIKGLPYCFTAQLDLGATIFIFKASILNPYLNYYSKLDKKVDYKNVRYDQDGYYPVVHDIKIRIGNNNFKSPLNILRREKDWNLPQDSIFSPTEKHIGTIGADLFENKVLIIDYPNERIAVLEKLPKSLISQTEFVKIKYSPGSNRIFLPFFIGGEERDIIFDTGASLYGLATSQKNISTFADTLQSVDTMSGNTWGKMLYAYGYKIKVPIYLGNHEMDSSLAYVVQDEDFEKAFESGEIGWGITGNKYFLDNTIIIDFKNQQFGIVKGDLP